MNNLTLGERRPVIDARGRHRGYKLWILCPVCEEGRWVSEDSTRRPEYSGMCKRCHPKFTTGQEENHSTWKGKRKGRNGYKVIHIDRDNFFRPMADKSGWITEHRFVMAQHYKRCLLSWEVVHHINGNKTDNRLENLKLLPGQQYHISDTILKTSIRELEKTIKRQKTIIEHLTKQMNEDKNEQS